MSRRKWIFVAVALLLMGGTAGLLLRLKANQRLGQPGVRTQPLPESRNLEVVLPELVLDYTSEPMPQEKIVTVTLPPDTSYGQRRYTALDGFWVLVNVVLMGSDRTSLHKPQFCLEGTGWTIDRARSGETTVRMERPYAYNLPVMKLVASRQFERNGQRTTVRGVYVYWFVAEDALTARHGQRMWWMARELLRTGVLQRWAYVTCFAICAPGQEDATFERMKKMMAASVPEFQLVPRPKETVAAAKP